MEKLKKEILDVMEAYQHIPFAKLAKNENAHRSILLGIENAVELFGDTTAEQIKYEVHDILTEVGLAKAEINAYGIDPPEDYFESSIDDVDVSQSPVSPIVPNNTADDLPF